MAQLCHKMGEITKALTFSVACVPILRHYVSNRILCASYSCSLPHFMLLVVVFLICKFWHLAKTRNESSIYGKLRWRMSGTDAMLGLLLIASRRPICMAVVTLTPVSSAVMKVYVSYTIVRFMVKYLLNVSWAKSKSIFILKWMYLWRWISHLVGQHPVKAVVTGGQFVIYLLLYANAISVRRLSAPRWPKYRSALARNARATSQSINSWWTDRW